MPNQSGTNPSNNDPQSFREDGGRIQPQAVEVEEAVLGAMLIEREAVTIAL